MLDTKPSLIPWHSGNFYTYFLLVDIMPTINCALYSLPVDYSLFKNKMKALQPLSLPVIGRHLVLSKPTDHIY